MTEPTRDTLTEAIQAALRREPDPFKQIVIDALSEADTPDPNEEGLAAIEAVLEGKPLALNDDAGLARKLGIPLAHDTHFSY